MLLNSGKHRLGFMLKDKKQLLKNSTWPTYHIGLPSYIKNESDIILKAYSWFML